MVATWAKAVSRYGRLSLATDLQPAIDVAQCGFRIDADFCQLEQSDLPELRAYTASRKLFLTPGGNPLPVGSALRNPDLASSKGRERDSDAPLWAPKPHSRPSACHGVRHWGVTAG